MLWHYTWFSTAGDVRGLIEANSVVEAVTKAADKLPAGLSVRLEIYGQVPAPQPIDLPVPQFVEEP